VANQNSSIKFDGISKSFPGVKALEDVGFSIEKNTVHAIVGENGAGKSTLLNILHGIYTDYEGDVYIEDNIVNFKDAKQALNTGVVKVHQEVSMVPELSVGQNIVLGYEQTNGFFIKRSAMHKTVNDILDQLGCNFRSENLAKELDIGDMQMASIAKAIYHKAKIISFDEPTASLSVKEKDNFFQVIEHLKQQGLTLVFISHHLDEIFEICDTVTVLRDGQYVNTVPTKNLEKNELVRMMVGREIKQLSYENKEINHNETVLEVENLKVNQVFNNISFSLKKGEILGFSGLVGSKRTDVMLTLIGALEKDSGTIKVHGKEANITSPAVATQFGIGLVPENRKTQGFVKYFSNGMNVAITKVEKFKSGFFVNYKSINKNAEEIGEKLNLRPNNPTGLTVNLSGGNQQKVVISKWLSADVDILILDEPTKGVDVGAKSEIYDILNEFVSQGKSIIIVSSELPEVLGLADRIMVMREGEIVKELKNDNLTEEDVLQYAMGV